MKSKGYRGLLGIHALASAGAVVSGWSLGGCADRGLSVAEADVVLTIEDEGRNYSDYATFFLPDVIADLCPSEDDDAQQRGDGGVGGRGGVIDPDDCNAADHRLDDALLDALREQMLALGYREQDSPEDADLAFFLGVLARDDWVAVSSPGYCYPYGYYYWGCWYPSYAHTYDLETNAYLIDLADTAETERGRVGSVWTAILQGLDEPSSEKTGAQRVRDGVEQAFEQSPYLAEGGGR